MSQHAIKQYRQCLPLPARSSFLRLTSTVVSVNLNGLSLCDKNSMSGEALLLLISYSSSGSSGSCCFLFLIAATYT